MPPPAPRFPFSWSLLVKHLPPRHNLIYAYALSPGLKISQMLSILGAEAQIEYAYIGENGLYTLRNLRLPLLIYMYFLHFPSPRSTHVDLCGVVVVVSSR